jgi:hypothetical protein
MIENEFICDHVWEERDDISNNGYRVSVRCVKCRVVGEKREDTQEVYWPAT